jgi:hypothetical protein
MFEIFRKKPLATQPAPQSVVTVESDQTPVFMNIWRRQDEHLPLNDELLRARLAETVAWCDALKSLDDFRSEPLRPNLFHDGSQDLVCDLGRSRQFQLRQRNLQINHQSPVVATGRFMLYFPDENLTDGYAEMVSGGFFDVYNLPPYDTWVSLVLEDDAPRSSAGRHLLCYVPAPLIGLADAGIDGNPESCIVWLDQADVPIRRRVEALTSQAPRGTTPR